jgi:hypothetical protein
MYQEHDTLTQLGIDQDTNVGMMSCIVSINMVWSSWSKIVHSQSLYEFVVFDGEGILAQIEDQNLAWHNF